MPSSAFVIWYKRPLTQVAVSIRFCVLVGYVGPRYTLYLEINWHYFKIENRTNSCFVCAWTPLHVIWMHWFLKIPPAFPAGDLIVIIETTHVNFLYGLNVILNLNLFVISNTRCKLFQIMNCKKHNVPLPS